MNIFRKKLESMLAVEQAAIVCGLAQVTMDPPLVVAEIRAGLLRELLRDLHGRQDINHHSPETVQRWLTRIVGHEGGYWDDPAAGPTKWGISQRSYPALDIASLTVHDAEAIYRRDYLAPLQADRYADGLAFQLLDFAVNSGQQKAISVMQRAMGLVADGVPGSKTQAAIAAKSESDMCLIVIAARLQYMASLKNWDDNSEGWANRMARNLLYAAADTD